MGSIKWPEIIVPFLVGILAVLFALVLNRGYETLGLEFIAFGLAVAISLVLGNGAVTGLMMKSRMEQRMGEQIEVVRQFVEPRKFEWLRPFCELISLEREVECKEIWLVSPHLRNDVGDGEFVPTVKYNAARGIRYTYIVPESALITARIQELREVFKENPDMLDVRSMQPREFSLLATGQVAVYNPRGEQHKSPVVFMELPIQGRGWWVEACPEESSAFVGKLTAVIEIQN